MPGLVPSLRNFTPSEIFRYYRIGFSPKQAHKADLENGILYFTAFQRYLFTSGVIGTFLGLIIVLATVTESAAMTRGLSVCLMTILYALVLNVGLAIPFKTGLQKRLRELEE